MSEKITADKGLLNLLEANLFLVLLDLILLFWKRNALPAKIPFFYSRPWGEEQLSANWLLFLIPAASFILLLLNFEIARILLKKGGRFLALVSCSFALLFSALGTITLWKIIFLIT